MKVYESRIVQVDRSVEWQAYAKAEGRRQLEAKRGKIMKCASCKKPIEDEWMIIAHIKNKKNLIVHETCADMNVEIKGTKNES